MIWSPADRKHAVFKGSSAICGCNAGIPPGELLDGCLIARKVTLIRLRTVKANPIWKETTGVSIEARRPFDGKSEEIVLALCSCKIERQQYQRGGKLGPDGNWH